MISACDDAIGAALRGESEPIRKYGVLLDDATLRNRALKMGLISTTKDALTPQQKALAAQAEILKQTKDQQGDFARTSDGLANKQRILKAEFSNMTTELGQKALPVMLQFVSALMATAEWVDQNHEVVVPLVAVLGGFAAAVWAINTAARAYAATQAALNIVLAANPVGIIVLALVALGAALVIAWKHSETFRDNVKAAFQTVAYALQGFWNSVLAPVFQMWGKSIGAVLWSWSQLLDLLSHVPGFGWAKDLSNRLHDAADKAMNLNLELDAVKKPRDVKMTSGSLDEALAKAHSLKNLLSDPIFSSPKASGAQMSDSPLSTTKPGLSAIAPTGRGAVQGFFRVRSRLQMQHTSSLTFTAATQAGRSPITTPPRNP